MINLNKPAELTADEIAAFEEKNKSREKVQVFEYDSKVTPDKPARFYVAKPNRLQLDAITETRETSRARSNELMINNGVLAGDVAQLEDDDALFFGLLRDISGLVEAKKKL